MLLYCFLCLDMLLNILRACLTPTLDFTFNVASSVPPMSGLLAPQPLIPTSAYIDHSKHFLPSFMKIK